MDLVCVIVLALASAAAGSLHPGAFGAKAGAAAKAEASAVSGAFGGLPAPAILSGSGGGAYSSSFSKSSASSFASSSASSSSYSYSGGFSGGIPGGTNGIGGAGCGGRTCPINAGAVGGSGAYSGSVPVGGPSGSALGSNESGTVSYDGPAVTGISSTASNHGTTGTVSIPFSGSTSLGATSPGLINGYSDSTTGSFYGTAPVGNIPSEPNLGSTSSGSGQYSNPTSTGVSSTGSNFGSSSNSAAATGTTSLSDIGFDSKYPTDVNKRPCSGDCANSGSSLSLNCKGTNCQPFDSKCTSSQCLSSAQGVSSLYNNNNDIPVSVSSLNIIKPTYGSSDISPNEGNDKASSLGSQCDTPNCNSPTQSNKENLYDGQYTSYNPKPSTPDTSVYGGQPHKCTSPSCSQSSQDTSSLSSSSQSTSQFTPSGTYSTSPKGSTLCNTPNCKEEPNKPNSYESNAKVPEAVDYNQGSSKPHNVYPELIPSKGSPCGLANCDNQENTYTTGNALPLTPTYNQNTNYKPSGLNCGPSGCGTPSYSTPPGNSYFSLNSQNSPSSSHISDSSYFSLKPQGTSSSSFKPSVPNCGVSGCGNPNYIASPESSNYPSSSQGSSLSRPVSENSYISSSPQGISSSSSRPSVTNCGAAGCETPNYNAPFGSSYFPSSSQGLSSTGSVSGSTYFPSSTHESVSPIPQGLIPTKPVSGISDLPSNYQGSSQSSTPSGITYFPSTPQDSPNSFPIQGSTHVPSTSQGLSPSSSVSIEQGAFGCGQTGGCANYPSSLTNNFGATGVSSGSHLAVKPVLTTDNKGPAYTGGFGAPGGFLKPNDYSVPLKPDYVSSQQPVFRPSNPISSVAFNQPSSVSGISNSGQFNPNSKPVIHTPIPTTSHSSGISASATAGASAVVYTGGFGGPPGLLKPYDNGEKLPTFPYYQGKAVSGDSGSSYGQGSLTTGNTPYSGTSGGTSPSFGGSLTDTGAKAAAFAGASAVAGSGALGGTSSKYDKQSTEHNIATNSALGGNFARGGCGGGCGSLNSGLTGGVNFDSSGSLSKTGLFSGLLGDSNTAGATAKSLSNAVSGTGNGGFGTGGSFASSSAMAHASASAGTKGGYGKR